MACCPHCGGTGQVDAVEADPTDQLRAVCRDRAIWVSPDDRVREPDAADLIGMAAKTLRNWRSADQPLPHIKRAGRPLYALADLAAWLTDRA